MFGGYDNIECSNNEKYIIASHRDCKELIDMKTLASMGTFSASEYNLHDDSLYLYKRDIKGDKWATRFALCQGIKPFRNALHKKSKNGQLSDLMVTF
ncbi:hypothetical protein ACFLYA_01205 [Candidatus Dependentiae bacterium]